MGEEITTTTEEETTTTTEEETTTGGRPIDNQESQVKESGKPKKNNQQQHNQFDDNIKDAMFHAVDRVMDTRQGKVKVLRGRMKGLGRKAIGRKGHRCPLSEVIETVATGQFNNVDEIGELETTFLALLDTRLDSLNNGKCKSLELNLSRKIQKIARKIRNQTRAK